MAVIQPQKSSDVQLQVPVFQPAPTQMNTMPYPVQFTGTALSNGIDGVLKGLQAGFQLRHQLADMPNEDKRAKLAGRYIDEANKAMDDYHQGKYDPLAAGLSSDASGATGMNFSKIPDLPMRNLQLQGGQMDLLRGASAIDAQNAQTRLTNTEANLAPYKYRTGLDALAGRPGPQVNDQAPASALTSAAQNLAVNGQPGQSVLPPLPVAGGARVVQNGVPQNVTPQAAQPTNTPPFSIDDAESYYLTHYGNDATSVNWVHPQSNQPGYYVVSRKGKDPVQLYPSIMASDPGDWRPSSAQSQTPAAGAPPVPSWATNAPLGQGAQDEDLAYETGPSTDTPQAQQRAQGAAMPPLPNNAVPNLPAANAPAPNKFAPPSWPPGDPSGANGQQPPVGELSLTSMGDGASTRTPLEKRPAYLVNGKPLTDANGNVQVYANSVGYPYVVTDSTGPYTEKRMSPDPAGPGWKQYEVPKPGAESLKLMDQIITEHGLIPKGKTINDMSYYDKTDAVRNYANFQNGKDPSEKQAQELSDYRSLLADGQQLKQLASTMDPGQFNFLSAWKAGAQNALGGLLGSPDPKRVAMGQLLSRFQNNLAQVRNGARITDTDVGRINAEIGTMNQRTFPQTFENELDFFRQKYLDAITGAQVGRIRLPTNELHFASLQDDILHRKGKGAAQLAAQAAQQEGVGDSSAQAAQPASTPSASPAQNSGNLPLVTTKAQFDALKPGDHFIDKDGVPGTK
jgi:hypothetical protein